MPDEVFALHERLISGDRTASEEVAERLLEPLRTEIQRSYPDVDEQVIADGVIDAILDYCAHPEGTRVTSGSNLHRLLATAAWRNVANALRSERRRQRREERFGRELAGADVEDRSTLGKLIGKEDEAARERRIQVLMQMCPDETDREVLRLRLTGERRTHAFAHVLGIEHLPLAEQRTAVKRAKDRIEKMIRRSEEMRR